MKDKRRESPNATLSVDQVLSIRAMLKEKDQWGRQKWSCSSISRHYASMGLFIGAESIRRMMRGETWAWLDETAAQASQAPEVSKEVIDASLERLHKLLDEPEVKISPEVARMAEIYGSPPKRD